MGRVFHFTEEQIKPFLSEITLSGDEELSQTKNIQTAAKNVVDNARNSGVNTQNGGVSVSFSADSLKNNVGIQERKNGIMITKRELDEMRLKKLREESFCLTKEQIINGL